MSGSAAFGSPSPCGPIEQRNGREERPGERARESGEREGEGEGSGGGGGGRGVGERTRYDDDSDARTSMSSSF